MAGRLSHLVRRFSPLRLLSNGSDPANPKLKLPRYSAGSPNLEVVKFGIYIMFPIGWMYYFGTNLDNRFSVPDFWPAPGSTHKIPLDREEQKDMEQKLRALRLVRKERRLEREKLGLNADRSSSSSSSSSPGEASGGAEEEEGRNARDHASSSMPEKVQPRNTFGISPLERWIRSK